MSEFTEQQAGDLARYFLGPEWGARLYDQVHILERRTARHSWTGPDQIRTGASWREVFRSVGVKLPVRVQFASVGLLVVREDERIATAVSKTMADRIANALNWYKPGPRGT